MTFEYLRQSLFFFRNNLGMIARIQLPFLVLFSLLGQMTVGTDMTSPEGRQAIALVMVANLLLMPIYQGATIAYLGSVIDNNPLSVGQSLAVGMARWRSLFLVYLLTGMAVFTGFMLLIIPGVFMMIRLFFADYACVIDKQGSNQALKSSWQDSSLYFWPLLNGLAPLALTLLVLQVGLGELLALDQPGNEWLSVPFEVLTGLLGSALTVYGFRIYCVMREERN
ncbi:MAG: hypothetical protein OIF57_07495 [Marinobacterium sp.]|nr:hypothetical protein [Marinobacterium sp.]